MQEKRHALICCILKCWHGLHALGWDMKLLLLSPLRTETCQGASVRAPQRGGCLEGSCSYGRKGPVQCSMPRRKAWWPRQHGRHAKVQGLAAGPAWTARQGARPGGSASTGGYVWGVAARPEPTHHRRGWVLAPRATVCVPGGVRTCAGHGLLVRRASVQARKGLRPAPSTFFAYVLRPARHIFCLHVRFSVCVRRSGTGIPRWRAWTTCLWNTAASAWTAATCTAGRARTCCSGAPCCARRRWRRWVAALLCSACAGALGLRKAGSGRMYFCVCICVCGCACVGICAAALLLGPLQYAMALGVTAQPLFLKQCTLGNARPGWVAGCI